MEIRALANTLPAWSKALTVPKLFTPYISAHKEPINGVLIPIFSPYKTHVDELKKIHLSNVIKATTNYNESRMEQVL